MWPIRRISLKLCPCRKRKISSGNSFFPLTTGITLYISVPTENVLQVMVIESPHPIDQIPLGGEGPESAFNRSAQHSAMNESNETQPLHFPLFDFIPITRIARVLIITNSIACCWPPTCSHDRINRTNCLSIGNLNSPIEIRAIPRSMCSDCSSP